MGACSTKSACCQTLLTSPQSDASRREGRPTQVGMFNSLAISDWYQSLSKFHKYDPATQALKENVEPGRLHSPVGIRGIRMRSCAPIHGTWGGGMMAPRARPWSMQPRCTKYTITKQTELEKQSISTIVNDNVNVI